MSILRLRQISSVWHFQWETVGIPSDRDKVSSYLSIFSQGECVCINTQLAGPSSTCIASWSIEEGICLSYDRFILECFLSVAAKSLQRALYIWLNLRVVDAPCCQSPLWRRQKTCHKYGSIIANFIWLSVKTRRSAWTRGPDSGHPNSLKPALWFRFVWFKSTVLRIKPPWGLCNKSLRRIPLLWLQSFSENCYDGTLGCIRFATSVIISLTGDAERSQDISRCRFHPHLSEPLRNMYRKTAIMASNSGPHPHQWSETCTWL